MVVLVFKLSMIVFPSFRLVRMLVFQHSCLIMIFKCILFVDFIIIFFRFLLMADFDAYLKCQEKVSETFMVRTVGTVNFLKHILKMKSLISHKGSLTFTCWEMVFVTILKQSDFFSFLESQEVVHHGSNECRNFRQILIRPYNKAIRWWDLERKACSTVWHEACPHQKPLVPLFTSKNI